MRKLEIHWVYSQDIRITSFLGPTSISWNPLKIVLNLVASGRGELSILQNPVFQQKGKHTCTPVPGTEEAIVGSRVV
jgi:hypothetical protein